VLDVGCGPGGGLPYLVDAVGISGEVVGVEISPEVSINARARIEKNEWGNVNVIEGAAQTVHLIGRFDSVLMFAAQDVFASQEALQNIFQHLRQCSGVVFGAKNFERPFGEVVEPVLRMLYRLNLSGAPEPDRNPWGLLETWVEKLHAEEYFFGLMFLASGSV
jgi:SAM-dependent methyltransferase